MLHSPPKAFSPPPRPVDLASLAARWTALVRQRALPAVSEADDLSCLAAMNEIAAAAARLPARTDAERAIKGRMLAQASNETTEDERLLSSGDAGIAAWARGKVEGGNDLEQLAASLVLDLLAADRQPSPDAALLALGEQFEAAWEHQLAAEAACEQQYDACGQVAAELNQRMNAASEAATRLCNQIADRPAATLAGVLVKVRAVACIYQGEGLRENGFDEHNTTDHRLVGSILCALQRLDGRPVSAAVPPTATPIGKAA